jgi:hypothetical protein
VIYKDIGNNGNVLLENAWVAQSQVTIAEIIGIEQTE